MSLEQAEIREQTGLDAHAVRRDFPALQQLVHGKPLAYLDNAATTQKPLPVLQAIWDYYARDNSNIHRGVHTLSQRATDAYEGARRTVQQFLNAADPAEIVFVRGTTEAINLVASSYGPLVLGPGRDVLITEMEHHANIVPWQLVCERTGAHLKVVPITDAGELRLDAFAEMLSERTAMVAVTHVSNALGTVNPVKQIIELAHAAGAAVLVDGAQAVGHQPVDLQQLGCDFYAFSGHKCLGPTGIGVLYGRLSLLEKMPPYQGGGDMIRTVTFERSTFNDPPARFEAGTPHIAGAVGLAAALEYLSLLGVQAVERHEIALASETVHELRRIGGVRIVGEAAHRAGIVSFVMDNAHPHDIGTILDMEGVAIRTGHHCAMPLMARLGLPATARASFALYNTSEDVEALLKGVHRVKKVFG